MNMNIRKKLFLHQNRECITKKTNFPEIVAKKKNLFQKNLLSWTNKIFMLFGIFVHGKRSFKKRKLFEYSYRSQLSKMVITCGCRTSVFIENWYKKNTSIVFLVTVFKKCICSTATCDHHFKKLWMIGTFKQFTFL
jgi:hypothetical protein